MFIGKYYYKLQANNRLSLPKDIRKDQKKWVVTRGLDGCLFVFKAETFEQELQQLAARSFTKKAHRDLIRIMSNEAKEVTVDSSGRVHLPEYLTKFAQLEDSVVIVGSFNRIEIWDQEKYHQYANQLEQNADSIAESVEL